MHSISSAAGRLQREGGCVLDILQGKHIELVNEIEAKNNTQRATENGREEKKEMTVLEVACADTMERKYGCY